MSALLVGSLARLEAFHYW